jgi:hypothetical protein
VAQQDLLIHTIGTLDRAGIEYMLTGSIVTSLQGEPRSTHDVDVIVAIHGQHVPALIAAFPRPRYYIDEGAIREAMRSGGMFNVIDVEEGDKVDFWMLEDSEFDRSRFARRYAEQAFGVQLIVPSPEDTILAKLRWARMAGGSDRHVRDAVGVYQVQQPRLDEAYLDGWAARLKVGDLLQRVRSGGGASPVP